MATKATKRKPAAASKSKAKYVLIRTYSAGVHCGELVARKGMDVILKQARRIWNWNGAFSLHEISLRGIKSGKISEPVPEITLTQAIEVIPFSKEGEACLRGFQSHKV